MIMRGYIPPTAREFRDLMTLHGLSETKVAELAKVDVMDVRDHLAGIKPICESAWQTLNRTLGD